MPSSTVTGVQTCALDRKSTRLNSSHGSISYAVFFFKKKGRSWRGGAGTSRRLGPRLARGLPVCASPCPGWAVNEPGVGAKGGVYFLVFFFFKGRGPAVHLSFSPPRPSPI